MPRECLEPVSGLGGNMYELQRRRRDVLRECLEMVLQETCMNCKERRDVPRECLEMVLEETCINCTEKRRNVALSYNVLVSLCASLLYKTHNNHLSRFPHVHRD